MSPAQMIAQIKHYTLAERAPSTLFTRHDEPTMGKTRKSAPIYMLRVGGKNTGIGHSLHKIFWDRRKKPPKIFGLPPQITEACGEIPVLPLKLLESTFVRVGRKIHPVRGIHPTLS